MKKKLTKKDFVFLALFAVLFYISINIALKYDYIEAPVMVLLVLFSYRSFILKEDTSLFAKIFLVLILLVYLFSPLITQLNFEYLFIQQTEFEKISFLFSLLFTFISWNI